MANTQNFDTNLNLSRLKKFDFLLSFEPINPISGCIFPEAENAKLALRLEEAVRED